MRPRPDGSKEDKRQRKLDRKNRERETRKMSSIYGRDGLDAIARADFAPSDEREYWAARRAEFWAPCLSRCAMAGALAVSVGIALAATRAARRRWGADGAGGGGVDRVERELARTCAEAKVRDAGGYDACHALCERAYCCFLPEWDPSRNSCVAPCAVYEKHCSVLERIDQSRQGNDEE